MGTLQNIHKQGHELLGKLIINKLL